MNIQFANGWRGPVPANGTRIRNTNAYIVQVTGSEVLVSYSTPVACKLASGALARTDQEYSITTSRHIRQFCGLTKRDYGNLVPQYLLDNLLKSEPDGNGVNPAANAIGQFLVNRYAAWAEQREFTPNTGPQALLSATLPPAA